MDPKSILKYKWRGRKTVESGSGGGRKNNRNVVVVVGVVVAVEAETW